MFNDILSPVFIFFWIILGILSVIALLGNGFITAMISHQWLQTGKMASCDFLLTSLSTSRFLLQLSSLLGYPVYFNIPEVSFYYSALAVMSISWFLFHITSLWSATWLSIFYCVKVTNFPNNFFFWLKTRINVLVPRLFAMSVTVSIIFSLPSFVCYFQDEKSCNLTDTQSVNNYQNLFFAPISLHFTIMAINFSLNVTASILLLASLWRHTRNLRKSGIAVKDLSTQVHIKVMKSVLLYLFLYVLYITSMMLATAHILKYGRPERLVTEILLSALSAVHSAILISTNPKLKKASAYILKIRERAS
ncbi:taste receptor type 2 member 7-like [Pogona vitticeps]